MALHLERSATEADTRASAIVEAGARGAGDYRCLDCGYGIVTFGLVPTCPMCHGAHWESARWSPFTARGLLTKDALPGEALAQD
jgi:lipopolysaccharide biosynthesis regulator YciM